MVRSQRIITAVLATIFTIGLSGCWHRHHHDNYPPPPPPGDHDHDHDHDNGGSPPPHQ